MGTFVKKIHVNTWIALFSYIVTFAFLYSATIRATQEPMGSAMFAAFLSVGFFIPVNMVLLALTKIVFRVAQALRPDLPASDKVHSTEDAEQPRTRERRFRLARPGASDVAYERSPSNNVSTASSRE